MVTEKSHRSITMCRTIDVFHSETGCFTINLREILSDRVSGAKTCTSAFRTNVALINKQKEVKNTKHAAFETY